MKQINLSARNLWGNEAADDERPEILNSYFVRQHKDDWDDFFNLDDVRYSIARARKGMGKSALLAECAYRNKDNDKYLVINIKGSDLIAHKRFLNDEKKSVIEYVFDWKQRICAVINSNLANIIGIAKNDDEMTIVENAEMYGFKSKSLLSALFDRLKLKIAGNEVGRTRTEIHNHEEILSRVTLPKKILLLIDDIDATFKNSPQECLNLSTFFSACREIAASFDDIIIRTIVRTDVWACIRATDESLDKVEQYIFDLNWSKNEFRSFLAERIFSYCKREKFSIDISNKEDLLPLVFAKKFPWGKSKAESYRVIHIYAGGRPRWAAQLCKLAGKETEKTKTSSVITFGSIKQVLFEYGQARLADIPREHAHQCPNIQDIINAFSKQRIRYTTQELLNFIENKIFSHMQIDIDGHKIDEPLKLARYLFRIGFIMGVDKKHEENPEYYQYEDKPSLLTNEANLDDGMTWMVHYAYQAVLSLK
ncbi:MAG: hypothetical protein Q4A84_03970 [Neisseria sp.]|uniref:P-loop ATPase, Sll1717 family n=1 Tax=Neisseria sp. TaxID=192066 RepID=UPI0026DB5AC0|nr:hypothetical protein [Neisseria sp.]MDO4640847.1 hypothetical protein [Neisseria sp.]